MIGSNVKTWCCAALLALAWSPAALAITMPSDEDQQVLIRISLLTFNDANLTGNYTVLQERSSKPFRDQLSADQLKGSFKEFVDKQIDLTDIAIKPAKPSQESKIDDDGILLLAGTIAMTASSTVTYTLKFIQSEGRWKIIGLNVKL